MKRYTYFLIVFLTTTLLACQSKDSDKSGNETGKTEAKADPVSVEGVLAVLGDFPLEFVSNGKLQANQTAQLFFNKQAPVKEIRVRNGDWVTSGQLIATLDNVLDQINLKQAAFQVESAQLDYEDRLIGHAVAVEREGLTTDKALNYFELASGLKSARLNLEKAQLDFDNTLLKAPFAGRIVDLKTKEMNYPPSAEPFCKVVDDRSFEVLFPVLESEIGRLKIGQKITLRTFVIDSVFYAGQITEINPVVDEHGLVTVKGLVQNTDGKLLQGMNVKVFIKDQVPNSLIVPKEAVVLRNNRQVVFTYSNGKAMWNYIQTILENSTSYSITKEPGGAQEILPGDTVITLGNLNLAHEARVDFKMVK